MNNGLSRTLASMLILALVCVLSYLPKLDNQYVYDDYAFVLRADENADVGNIPGFFATDTHRLYRPLRQTLYTLVRHFWGLSPVAHHVVGILLHALVTILFFLTLVLLLDRPRLAFLAAAFAALHPVHVARVANVTGSFDLLGLTLAYGALAASAAYLKSGRHAALLGALALFVLGLFGSEEAATVPLFVVLFFFATDGSRENAGRFGRTMALMLAVLAVYLAGRFVIVPGFSRVETYATGGLAETIWTMAVVFWRYIGLSVLPVGLAAEHAATIYPSLSLGPMAALTGMMALVVAATAVRRKQPALFLAVGWFFIGLAPFSNLIPLQTLFAEHYLYSGLMGFCIALALVFDTAWNRAARVASQAMVLMALVAVLVTYAVLTTIRIDVWQDDESLWSDSLAKEPDTYMANLNWGSHLRGVGRIEQACPYFEKAAKIRPTGPEAYVGLGNCKMEEGRPDLARALYIKSLENREGHVPALHGLMQADVALGELQEAAGLATSLLQEDPEDVVSLSVVGYILARTGRCDEAIPVLSRTVRLDPPEPILASTQANLKHCQRKASETENP